MALLTTDDTVVARVPGLVPLRRGSRVMVVAPRTGASVLLSGGRLRAFGRLERPTPVAALRADLPEEELEPFLQELERGGFLSVAGRPPRGPQPSPARSAFAAVLKLPVSGVAADLPQGRLLVEFVGAPDAQEIRAAVQELRRLRPGSVAWVRTDGALLFEPDTGANLAWCLRELPDPALLQRLPQALAAGLSIAPVALVSRPGQAMEFFRFLTDLGYRTMRFEGCSAQDLVALGQAAWSYPAPLQIHPLDDLARRLLSGEPGQHEDRPQCRRCAFGRTCNAQGEDFEHQCHEWRTIADGLLWLLKVRD